MSGNFSTVLDATVGATASSAVNVLSVFAAGAVSGAGASYLAQEFSKRLQLSKDEAQPTKENKVPVSSDPYYGLPVTKAQVEATYPEGTWQRTAFEEYSTVLLDEERIFPCIYATKGYKGDEQRYIFIDGDDLSEERHIFALASALSKYLPYSRSLGPNTSCVLLAKHTNNPRPMEEYLDGYWKMLAGLHRLDSKAWPSDIPHEIDTSRWCLCFAGEPWFSVIQTPAHQNRLSRYAKGVTIVFQPKWIFDVLFATEAKRQGALSKVRALLKKYDPVPVSPDLKNYGDETSRESKQYFLLDENVTSPCPYAKLGETMPAGHP